ncbi:MAG: helix-turn-helix domain-containing protein [Planctomycetes bacterium]|nr:helix-turn-helix domain-containing protein [Planctomycetota bacterium]
MDDVVIRLTRVIASDSRLAILSYLAEHGEATPTQLKKELRIPLNTLSTDLRILAAVGLIKGRRSGAQCYYSFASPYGEGTLSGDMSRWLRSLLSGSGTRKSNCELPEVRNRSSRRARPPLHATIFEAATAFTDLRRLQILRYLEAHAEATVEEFVRHLHMSPHAVSRQTSKLRRRGLVVARKREAGRLAFSLAAEYKTPIHQRMHEIVRATWRKK